MNLLNLFRKFFVSNKQKIEHHSYSISLTSDITVGSDSYVFLDTETTGLNYDGMDEIVEIAIVDESGRTLLNTLVKPRFNDEWTQAERVHGISPHDVANSPALSDLLAEIELICKGKTVVCYNAAFDTGFFPKGFYQSVQCAMVSFSEVNPNGKKWVSLDKASQSTGYVPTGKSHRALEDALACRHVWMIGIEAAKKMKETQLIPSINARYTTVNGDTAYAVFDEINIQELENIKQGVSCKLWSKDQLDFINVYYGGMGGSGKIASLRKEENPSLAELVTEDNEVLMHVRVKGDAYFDCEITVSRKQKAGHFQSDVAVNYDEIDNDIYRCFIAHKSGLCDFIGTHAQLNLIEEQIEKLCASNKGRYYKSKAKGAKFAIIFSTSNHSPGSVYRLQQDGYKVTTFDRVLVYFGLTHMWNLKNYLEHKEMMKSYVSILD